MLSILPKSTAVSPAPLMLTFSVPAVKVTLSVAAWLVNQAKVAPPTRAAATLRSANWQKPQLHLPSLLVLFLAFLNAGPFLTLPPPQAALFLNPYSSNSGENIHIRQLLPKKNTLAGVLSLLGRQFLQPVHIRPQGLGDGDAAVGVLVVFQRGMRIRGEAIPVLFRV